jgi:hypothetical protein
MARKREDMEDILEVYECLNGALEEVEELHPRSLFERALGEVVLEAIEGKEV